MYTSPLILELNNAIDPNPFNSGPPPGHPPSGLLFSSSSYFSSPSSTYSPALFHRDLRTPDLISTPSSTLSAQLEDEEIRRIFSNHEVREKLNPFAATFVPTFAKPPISDPNSSNLYYSPDHQGQISPLVSFQALDFPSHHTALPVDFDAPQMTAIPPPGLPYPPMYAPITTRPPPTPINPPNPFESSFRALSPGTIYEEQQAFTRLVVAGYPAWSFDELLQLSETIIDEASGPLDFEERVRAIPLCTPEKYFSEAQSHDSQTSIPDANATLAVVVKELYIHFFEIFGLETANAFVWHLREVLNLRFVRIWAPHLNKRSAFPMLNDDDEENACKRVRSGLSLCQSIAAMFKQDLLMVEHVRAWITVLCTELKFVEQIKAISTLILGCGPELWKCTSKLLPNSNPEETNVALPSSTLLFPLVQGDELVYSISHVEKFLAVLEAGLEANSNITDSMSMVGQPWGQGQVSQTLVKILEAVRPCEATLKSALKASVPQL